MMAYKIEKNVTIPPKNRIRNELGAVIQKMECGDSVVIKKGSYGNLWKKAKERGIKITTRTLPNDLIRFWKI